MVHTHTLSIDYSAGGLSQAVEEPCPLPSSRPEITRVNSITIINPDSSNKDIQAEYFFASDARCVDVYCLLQYNVFFMTEGSTIHIYIVYLFVCWLKIHSFENLV